MVDGPGASRRTGTIAGPPTRSSATQDANILSALEKTPSSSGPDSRISRVLGPQAAVTDISNRPDNPRRMRSLLERASSLSMTTSSLTRGRLQLEQILSRPTQWRAFLDTAPRGRYQARLSPRRPEWRPTIS